MTQIEDALRALQHGEVIGFPTDTVYGIGADPFTRAAVERLFGVKGRPEDKAISILAADLAGVRQVADLSEELLEEAGRYWPGALTVVATKAEGAPEWIGDPARGTVGVRIPDHPVALEILANGPLAVTSANRSGEQPARDHIEAEAALGSDVAVYVPGRAGGGTPSTVVDLTHDPVVLRTGPVEWMIGGK